MLRLRFALLVAVVVVTAHDATYLIGHGVDGYATALGATGHDSHWLPVALGVAALILGAAAVAAARWWRLRRRLARIAGNATEHRIEPILPRASRLAARLAVVALVVFVVQENLEAIAIGAAAPGPGIILAPGYAAIVPVLAAVALLFALMSELIDARILSLERAIAFARSLLPRASTAPSRRPLAARRSPGSRSSQPDLGRAPPASAPA